MFSNLIESGSHAADLKRKGRFLLGTTLFYALLLAFAGVGSIYAYNVRLDDGSAEYEMLTLLRFPPAEAHADQPRREEQQRAATSPNRSNQIATRTEISVQTPYHSEQIARIETRETRPGQAVQLGPIDFDPPDPGGIVGPRGPGSASSLSNTGPPTGPSVTDTTEPPPARPAPTPTPQRSDRPVALPPTIIASKAIDKPAPPYPQIAKVAGIQGPVAVQIVVDEQGRVVSAKATSGNPLLQPAAIQAAFRARFTPTILNGQPVKVTGSITYNFVIR